MYRRKRQVQNITKYFFNKFNSSVALRANILETPVSYASRLRDFFKFQV
jgi:hypothetical protein